MGRVLLTHIQALDTDVQCKTLGIKRRTRHRFSHTRATRFLDEHLFTPEMTRHPCHLVLDVLRSLHSFSKLSFCSQADVSDHRSPVRRRIGLIVLQSAGFVKTSRTTGRGCFEVPLKALSFL